MANWSVPAEGPTEATRVPAVERAINVLRLLAAHGPSSLSQLVNGSGLNKSTVFYIMRTLVALDMVDYDEAARTYALGYGLVELGLAAGEQSTDIALAKRELVGLLDVVHATIVLYRRVGRDSIVLVDKLERPHQVHITLQAGVQVPVQGGSFGRAFLAFDEPAEITAALRDGLHKFTPKSVMDVREFRRQLAQVREQGWAVDHEGFSLGVSTVAAPVFKNDGRILLVAAIVGFTNLVDDDVARQWGGLLREACDRIGHRLQGKGTRVSVAARQPWEARSSG
jgi:DNA-binding IclR family transcriptional regulator